ncbi:Peptide chain release factor 1 [Candidatus Xiphinematobacter sp. Idaho Grape]|uniref:peptide chain release factor 1 n=1 Tax=Candidatus Xiphinematobacter sp. Idaho Grape TaxID=1704307 RepID=UPI0007068C33|nr:peptide chain release factor 1 [Candidatus Xiphinematobacter sp. Idaho Grape]ALJ56402.1 Peptide chain release factor 1 [Candidatus Xiphinematobacter sp. Idaho Grape]
MDLSQLIEKKISRLTELEHELGKSGFFSNVAYARQILREHACTKHLVKTWKALLDTRRRIAEDREFADGTDREIAELALAEIAVLESDKEYLEREVRIGLLPPAVGEGRDAIIEIRAGTGGLEATLFAADLYRMYCRYSEANELKTETMDVSESELGGLKEVTFKMSGEVVFRRLRYESGVHRVQRVPATETQGRIHTSTATVAVLPEAQEIDIDIFPQDLRIEVCRAGGPGGQGVNTTDSAVQVLHVPTGKIVRCQDGRSQQQNKERALQILRSRLLEEKRREEEKKYSAHRKNLIGSGGRGEKIRTYNFPQNRVTDHRIGLTLYSLDRFIEGEIHELIEALQNRDLEERVKQSFGPILHHN